MIKAALTGTVTRILTSPGLRETLRQGHALSRKLKGRPAVVYYFHEAADPYSHLTAQTLERFAARYGVTLTPHLVPAPMAAAAPEPDMLSDWGLRDARLLAQVHGLSFPASATLPDPADVALANQVLTRALADSTFLTLAAPVGTALWSGDRAALQALPQATQAQADAALEEGEAKRAALRHYLGATFQFEGEWYWGLDRLHFLEARLTKQGLDRVGGSPMFQAHDIVLGPVPARSNRPVLHAFLSFRSPYSYICLPRVKALADHYGAELRLRFVMPMVMRGLPVPRMKSIYITTDTKREAERLGMSFGTILDPVGLGVERGLAVLHQAIQGGQGYEFALSFLQGAFADGIDATTDAGLGQMARRAGVSPEVVKAALADESWRTVAEANREEMFGAGLWGVPSFRVDDGEARWGQDRLWAIERDLTGAN
jgi:2-hydroxychromene-2-carboxylate isomerase